MGERVNGIHEVRGSIPLASTGVVGAGRARSGDGNRARALVFLIRTAGGPGDGDRSLGSPRGNSSVGRAQPCQGWGRGFESRFPLSEEGLKL